MASTFLAVAPYYNTVQTNFYRRIYIILYQIGMSKSPKPENVALLVKELIDMPVPPADRDRAWLADLSEWPSKIGVADCIQLAVKAGADPVVFKTLGDNVGVTLVDTRPVPLKMWGTCFGEGAGGIPRDPRDYVARLIWPPQVVQQQQWSRICLTVTCGRQSAYAASNGRDAGHFLNDVLAVLSPADREPFTAAFLAAADGLTGELIREQFRHELARRDAEWREKATSTIRRLSVATERRAFNVETCPLICDSLPSWVHPLHAHIYMN